MFPVHLDVHKLLTTPPRHPVDSSLDVKGDKGVHSRPQPPTAHPSRASPEAVVVSDGGVCAWWHFFNRHRGFTFLIPEA